MDDSLPKYLNSPETEIYSKGRNLYGLFQARKAIRDADSAIVVEGYLDLIACHEAGAENAVASLGTALTSEQVRLLKRHTRNALILYDADKAGEAATLRGLELFLEEEMDVKIVRLPGGHDPDSFVRDEGKEAFVRALAGAKSLFDYKLALLKEKFDPGSMEGKVRIANEMVSLFSRVRNEILKSAWVKELAAELRLSEEAILSEMQRNRGSAARAVRTQAQPADVSEALRPVEKLLIGIMLENPGFITRAKEDLGLEDFQSRAGREIVRYLFESEGSAQPLSAAQMINFYKEDTECARVVSLACAEAESVLEKERTLTDCVLWMKRSRMTRERDTLRSEILSAESSGDQNRIASLLHDLNELNKGMKKSMKKIKKWPHRRPKRKLLPPP